MTELSGPERALGRIAAALASRGRSFALVGGLAVSLRAEVRFTRDVDVAVDVGSDTDAEALVLDLAREGYRAIATVEHETAHRLSTVRLASPERVVVDLLFASSGIEHEITARAKGILVPQIGSLPVARAEELLAMKVLSMSDARLQDRLDAMRLLELSSVDLEVVRADLALIEQRRYSRGQNLRDKLDGLLVALASAVP